MFALLLALASAGQNPIDKDWPTLETLYQELHAHPELSQAEVKTAARMAAELKSMGAEVTTEVGGTGVVGIMKNGRGPTVLLRADMDGLPLEEQTGLPYASTDRGTDRFGEEHPTMHACGHDVHMTSLIGALRYLTAHKNKWRGTLMVVFQPAEELGLGAKAMLDDGLYSRFPVPDVAFALHDTPAMPSGTVGVTPGWALANVDSVDIHVRGVGGHGAYPHTTVDPIVLSSRIVTALQTLVSREISPLEPGVVTVGAFHAGTKHNIISDRAHLQLTVRSTSDATREALLTGIARIAKGEGIAAGLPEDLLPEVIVEEPYTPATWNDPALADKITKAFRKTLGADHVVESSLVMGGEDFAHYSRTDDKVPAVIFWIGASTQEAVDAAKSGGPPLPSLHSPFFAPDAQETITTGAQALVTATMAVVGR